MKKLLFLSYSSITREKNGAAYIGVLKRCLRLIAKIERTGISSIHLINIGEIPMGDPLIDNTLSTIELTNWPHYHAAAMLELINDLQPDVMVLGEGQINDSLRAFGEIAYKKSIPLICIENYYDRSMVDLFRYEEYCQDHWFLLGISPEYPYGKMTSYATFNPPLLEVVNTDLLDYEPYILCFGYTLEAIPITLEVMGLLGTDMHLKITYAEGTEHHVHEHLKDFGREAELIPMPTDEHLSTLIAGARLVVCKSGYQQITESLALGTPLFTFEKSFSVPHNMIREELKPYIVFLPFKIEFLDKTEIDKLQRWIKQKPEMPWTKNVMDLGSPIDAAAQNFHNLVLTIKSSATDRSPGDINGQFTAILDEMKPMFREIRADHDHYQGIEPETRHDWRLRHLHDFDGLIDEFLGEDNRQGSEIAGAQLKRVGRDQIQHLDFVALENAENITQLKYLLLLASCAKLMSEELLSGHANGSLQSGFTGEQVNRLSLSQLLTRAEVMVSDHVGEIQALSLHDFVAEMNFSLISRLIQRRKLEAGDSEQRVIERYFSMHLWLEEWLHTHSMGQPEVAEVNALRNTIRFEQEVYDYRASWDWLEEDRRALKALFDLFRELKEAWKSVQLIDRPLREALASRLYASIERLMH